MTDGCYPTDPEKELQRLRAAVAEQRAQIDALRLRQEAVRGVRDLVAAMETGDDLRKVVAGLRQALVGAGVPLQAFSVSVIRSEKGRSRAYLYPPRPFRGPRELPEQAAATLMSIWRSGQPAYRPDVLADDPYGEREAAQRWKSRSILDVPYSQGTVAVSSSQPHAFEPQHIELLTELSQVLSEGFRRHDDMASGHEAHTEANASARLRQERAWNERRRLAITGARDAVWNMQGPDDFAAVAIAIRQALEEVGLEHDAFAINLLRVEAPSPRFQTYSVRMSGRLAAERQLTEEEQASLARIWRRGEVAYRPDIEADDPFGEAHLLKDSRLRALLDVPFVRGTLSISSETPDAFAEPQIGIMQELARVVSEGVQRAEDLNRLAVSEKRFRSLVETPPDMGLMLVDRRGGFVYVSPQIERLTGMEAQRFYEDASIVRRIVHPDDAATAEAGLRQALRGEKVEPHELRWLHPDGTFHWARQHQVPVFDGQQRVEGVQVIYSDITPEKKAEEDRLHLERLRVLAEAAGGAAHSINQPLQAISGELEMMQEQLDGADPARGRIEVMLDQVQRIGEILVAMRNVQNYATVSYPGGASVVDYAAASDLREPDGGAAPPETDRPPVGG